MSTYAERVAALIAFLRERNVQPITDYSPYVTPTALSTGLAGKADADGVVRTVNGAAPDDAGNVSVAGATSAYELRGTGFPEGVVTADPGTYYTDVAGTNGAWRWLKASGTGATGWQTTVGDTGWRRLAVDQAVAGTGTSCFLRMANSTVSLHVVVHGNPTTGAFATVPAEFLSDITDTQVSTTRPGTTLSTTMFVRVSGGTVHLVGNTDVINMHAWLHWPRLGTWPAVLPGTPL